MRATVLSRRATGLTICLIALLCGGLFAGTSPANANSLVKAQGFDACSAPSASFMSTWWSSSPFFFLGTYIGGSNESCSQPNVTYSWMASIRGDGWDVLPLWVGRQTTCYGGSGPISTNQTTAYNEGISSADNAYSAATGLGIGSGNTLFADLEASSPGWTTTCLHEAEWYLAGWDAEMNTDRYYTGGVYGSAEGSDMGSLASYTGSATKEAFIADYAGSGGTNFQTGSSITNVYGLSGVSDSYWNPDARIRQFWQEDTLTYGGSGVNLDQDCADAYLTGTNAISPGC